MSGTRTDFDRLGYLINSWDLAQLLTSEGIPHIYGKVGHGDRWATAAAATGVTDWDHVSGNRGAISVYVPHGAVIPAEWRYQTDAGNLRPLKVVHAPHGVCMASIFEVGASADGCDQPAVGPGGRCQRHTNLAAKRAERKAAREAKWEAQQEQWRREDEANRRADELLAAILPLLTELGVHPDTVKVNGGRIALPAEAVKTLADLATEAIEMREL